MLLEYFKVRGFRRVELENNLQLSGKLVSIVGPNEAGKTSILHALAHCENDQPISESDQTFLSSESTKLQLSFFLEQDDIVAAGISAPSWLHVFKDADGGRTYDLVPRPVRKTENRVKIGNLLSRLYNSPKIRKYFEAYPVLEELVDHSEELKNAKDELNPELIENLESIRDVLEEVRESDLPQYALPLNAALSELISYEKGTEPFQNALNILVNRVPNLLLFGPEDRDLQIPFDLNRFEHSDASQAISPSKPLAEIIRLSNLDLRALKAANLSANGAVVAGLLEAANLKLKEISEGIWSQSDAQLYFTVEGRQLDLLVKNEKEFEPQDRYNNFKQRSDGYKQFIALQVFSFLKHKQNPILLIDEIEQHLHYDAQADLIQLLQNDENIKKVIYTTHSAGCLPEDLGSGVRLVQWDNSNKKRSKVINRFWFQNDENGFRPLLFGMGATTMAFFPTRKALIGEGPTELLLMPRLLREALNLETLGFQVIHGLANINPSGLPMMDGTTDGIAYIVDNDASGEKLAEKLETAKVPKSNIFSIGEESDAITFEDLLEENVWMNAVNRYIDQYGDKIDITERLTSVPNLGRIEALPEPLQKQKINYAYNIIEQCDANPLLRIVSPERLQSTIALGSRIRKILKLES